MDTKINEFAANLMKNAFTQLKEAKTKKAENAFYSLLDTAINGNSSETKTDGFQNLSANTKNSDNKPKTDNMNEKPITEEKPVTNNDSQKVSTDQSNQSVDSTKAEDTVMNTTDLEKAEAMIKEICEELGITEEELFAQFDQLLSAIAAMLMETFNVTEQELNLVLNDLGLSLTDMFNQTDLLDTIVVLAGAEDMSAVLTDENLYQQIQDISKELTTLQEAFAPEKILDAEQLKGLEESIEVIANAEPVVQEKDSEVSYIPVTNKEANLVEEVVGDEPVLEIVTNTSDSQSITDRKANSQNSNQGQSMTGQEGFQQFATRIAEHMDHAVVHAGNEFAAQADMEAIIKQVTDYVKLQVNAQTTSLEMQLHPESYGKLNLQVSVREGVVTAKMAVENENVKAALESQIVQLREDMNERGLKVDAVEVTIASHEFERNLDEGQENQESPQDERTRGPRQINLQDENMSLEELAAMSEAEALTRKIMLENGNSIDFSA